VAEVAVSGGTQRQQQTGEPYPDEPVAGLLGAADGPGYPRPPGGRSQILDESAARHLAAVLKALADPVRLRLLSLVARAPGGTVCACSLAEPLGRTQPTVSHHLKALRHVGLVEAERRGTWIWYSVRGERIDELCSLLEVVTHVPTASLASFAGAPPAIDSPQQCGTGR
jgi:ArsR family transcriptional regulator, arsenate/arsenite/antimonite-responsive transcriptional repressor